MKENKPNLFNIISLARVKMTVQEINSASLGENIKTCPRGSGLIAHTATEWSWVRPFMSFYNESS